MSVKTVSLNYNEQTALTGIIDEITANYPFIKKIIIYGSKARGDFIEESDIDLLFITDKDIPRTIKTQISDIIYNYELANDIVVSAIFIAESEFNEKVSLFLIKVKKEGIILWSRG